MTDEPEVEEQASDDTSTETASVDVDSAEQTEDMKVASSPEFMEVEDTSNIKHPVANASLDRFLDVEVVVAAEIGRVKVPLGELVGLAEGSVVELNRAVSSPVDLIAQGKRVATGEIVVIDDCFAIRIKSIEPEESNGNLRD